MNIRLIPPKEIKTNIDPKQAIIKLTYLNVEEQSEDVESSRNHNDSQTRKVLS